MDCNDYRDTDETVRSTSAPTSPTQQSRQISGCLTRGQGKGHHRVQFPEDNCIVTGYFEAPDPYQYVIDQSIETLYDSYVTACGKQNIKPIPRVVQQLKKFKCNQIRGQDLILKGERLDYRHCEALEEILKRVMFRKIDLDSCDLDGEGASALFDMIEFYESASHLCLANNKSIGVMGWQALCRTLKKTSCLQFLNLSNTGLNEQILLIMGRAMRLGSHLVTIYLENSGLYGRRLAILVAALKLNTNLRELYLGDNKICSADGVQIGNLLRANSCLDILDLRRNHIQDIGVDHICEGLSHQCYGGLKILNLSDNQITSRPMNHLSQSLIQCRSLIGLDLSYNGLSNDGISILKEGLISCKELKYLNLRADNINCEGAITISQVIEINEKLIIVDLSDNQIQITGLKALCSAIKLNKRIVSLKLSQYLKCNDNDEDEQQIEKQYNDLLTELNDYCLQNKTNTVYEEPNELLESYLESHSESDLTDDVFNDISDQLLDDDSRLNDNESRPDVISDVMNGSNGYSFSKPDIVSMQENLTHSHHKPIARTVSLGSCGSSYDSYRQSGRFSVSPVNLDSDSLQEQVPQLDITPDEMPIQTNNELNTDNNNQITSELNETNDQLMDLPKKMSKNQFLSPESPYNKNIRRMSSPNLSQTNPNTKPKVRSINLFKSYTHLESLDLKSSLPISPTFFGRFEFPDPLLLRLPPEVDDIIAKFGDCESSPVQVI
ncbi:protein phosphatase 1 regulatory subunit 37-like [Oppia nitens]|uniref:protein phosphatase 1 regulatory subunit 37-like n=1 Tax=Oppia nitens TaxID=1686743 RepID=UPI0023DAEC9E|nr:protein phosphatase 1 regulatory subunit 37-like [Oppia nitens]